MMARPLLSSQRGPGQLPRWQAHTLAQQERDHLLTSFPAWDVHAEACADSPALAVIKKADAWQPDLIVLGSHGRSAVSRFLLGSVSQKALTAVHAVAARAWPAGSAARLVTTLDARMCTAIAFMEPSADMGTVVNDADAAEWMSKTDETLAAPLRTRGLTVSSVLKEGDPKHVLLDEAEQWGADGIFVGARGLSRVERFLLSSVSAAVATRAHCSVEVIHPART